MIARKDQRCGNCDAFLPQGREGLCRARPPTPIMIGLGQPALALGNTGPVPAIQSFFPQMRPEGWCRGWALKIDGEG